MCVETCNCWFRLQTAHCVKRPLPLENLCIYKKLSSLTNTYLPYLQKCSNQTQRSSQASAKWTQTVHALTSKIGFNFFIKERCYLQAFVATCLDLNKMKYDGQRQEANRQENGRAQSQRLRGRVMSILISRIRTCQRTDAVHHSSRKWQFLHRFGIRLLHVVSNLPRNRPGFVSVLPFVSSSYSFITEWLKSRSHHARL